MNEYPYAVSQLPEEKCLATIKNRPLMIQLVFLVLAILLIIFTKLWYVGVFFLLLGAVSLAVTKEYIACKLYAGQLALFNPLDQEKINLINYDDIINYEMDSKSLSYIALTIKNQDAENPEKRLVIATFQASKLKRKLTRLLPGKDINQQKLAEFQASRLKNKEIKERKKKAKES